MEITCIPTNPDSSPPQSCLSGLSGGFYAAADEVIKRDCASLTPQRGIHYTVYAAVIVLLTFSH